VVLVVLVVEVLVRKILLEFQELQILEEVEVAMEIMEHLVLVEKELLY